MKDTTDDNMKWVSHRDENVFGSSVGTIVFGPTETSVNSRLPENLTQSIYLKSQAQRIAELEREVAAKQARIDALILEYCPEEMTPEKLEELGDIEMLRKYAERYRRLRECHWSNSQMCVVMDPKKSILLGSDCPSRELLDAAVDNL